jgi:hypothetical protein
MGLRIMPGRKLTLLISAIGFLLCAGLTASASARGASIEQPIISGVAQDQSKPGASNGQAANPCTFPIAEVFPGEDVGAIGPNTLRGIAIISPDDIWAVGYYVYGTYQMLTMHWDGAQWTIVPTGIEGPLYAVTAIASNDVWATGSYRIIHWNGQAWSQSYASQYPYGTLFNDIDALASNDVWAVGGYYQEEQNYVSVVMRWNGTQWSRMDIPQHAPQNDLYGIDVVAANDVWVVGGGNSTTGYYAALIMHWNGSTWTRTSTPPDLNAREGPLRDIAVISSNDIWAVGWDIDYNPYRQRSLTLHWDGAEWAEVPNPGLGRLNRVTALAPDDVWAVGLGTNLHWDGKNWTDAGITESLYDVTALPSGELWAVGEHSDPIDLGARTLTLRHDGEIWTTVPSPNITRKSNNLAGVAAISSDDVWAVGGYGISSGTRTLAQHWNGQGWSIVSTPLIRPSNYLNAVTAVSSNDVWAAGYALSASYGYSTLVEHWNGQEWSVIPSPNADEGPGISNYLNAISAAAANDIWAVGYHTTNSGQTILPLTMHWNGTQWDLVPVTATSTNSRLDGVVAISSDDAWAVGRDNEHTFTVHWDGTQWNIVPSPNVGSDRNFLHGVSAASSNSVWAVGYYGPGGTGQTLVLHWDGNAWNVVPSPNAGDISFLIEVDAPSDDNIWAVGNYFTGGIPRTLAMHWGGSSWTIIPSLDESAEGSYLNGIDVLSGDDVWAAGNYKSQENTYNLIEHFNLSDAQIFSDVSIDNVFYPYVQCLVCKGTISGYSDGTFRPNNDLTRGQLSKIVSNSAGFTDDPGEQIFEDVPPASTFYKWVNRLANRGYIGGYPCGGPGEPCGSENLPYFRPNANTTRGQISKIVSNAAGYEDTPPGQTFEDVPPSNTFYLWIERLASRGIMGGYPCGSEGEPCGLENKPYFRWMNNATRGQTSKIVANTFFPNCQVAASP